MGNTTQMTSVMSSYSQLASDDLEPASPYPQASLASATAQLHDEPVEPSQRPASHSVQDLVNSAANQMTVYKEVCQCANDPELVQAVRLRLERTQADLQSLVTVEEDEEALMRLLTANEEIHGLLSAPLPCIPSPDVHPSPEAEAAVQAPSQEASEVQELSDLLGVATAPPQQFVRTRSEQEFDSFFQGSSNAFGGDATEGR